MRSTKNKLMSETQYASTISKPTTVQEVLTGRRMLEAYCLRYATCVGKPELLGKNFEECLDQDAAEMVREQDDLHAK
jgi:hypothetical protein